MLIEFSLAWYNTFADAYLQIYNTFPWVSPVALKQRWRLNIKLEFVTTEHSGLLLFNGRYDGKHDFIAVEVWQGQVRFRFSLFSQTVTITSNVNGGVIDGKWHKVEVAFENRVWYQVYSLN